MCIRDRPYTEADILVRAGDTHLAMGDEPAARAAWAQALTLLQTLGHPDARQVAARLTGREDEAGAC